MGRLEPDMSVFKEIRNQPEFHEQLWQYINRRVSEWRIIAGKDAAKQNADLLGRIERDFGVERGIMLGLWGVEFDLRRPDRAEEPHEAGVSVARRTGLERAAAARLLG